MNVLSKFSKSQQLAPGSIELNDTAQSLDGARFERDARLHDLTTEFIRRRDEIQKQYVDKVAEISAAEAA
jgi:hypothetical protein